MTEPLTSLSQLEAALARKPFGLACDVDGTLSPMASTPGEATVTPRNRALLEALSRQIPVAVLSGRDLPDLRRMLDIPTLAYVGLHGLMWWIEGREELALEGEAYRPVTLEAAQQLHELSARPGLTIEVKTVGLAIHYRGATEPAAARAAILEAIRRSAAASRFDIHEGILMIELRPPNGITKGVGLRRLAKRFGLRGLLFLGDDVTDIDGFVEARRLRETGEAAAYGVAVVHPEAPRAAAEAADFTVTGIDGVEWLLGEIAKHLGAEINP